MEALSEFVIDVGEMGRQQGEFDRWYRREDTVSNDGLYSVGHVLAPRGAQHSQSAMRKPRMADAYTMHEKRYRRHEIRFFPQLLRKSQRKQ